MIVSRNELLGKKVYLFSKSVLGDIYKPLYNMDRKGSYGAISFVAFNRNDIPTEHLKRIEIYLKGVDLKYNPFITVCRLHESKLVKLPSVIGNFFLLSDTDLRIAPKQLELFDEI